ncbi:C4-dicarboxylate transporter DcuC [Trueperella sp. LYQ143]|uniref:C4-dicarboxylate transporter DcuC n=1 Tax=unclassified Trueperella TaxID=2630174 RepID=UPI00398365B1
MLEIIIILAALGFVGFLIAKKVKAAAALLAGGMLLLLISVLLGHVGDNTMLHDEKALTGVALVDQLSVMKAIIMKNLTGSGLIIMVLFGYTAYMDTLGANTKTVRVLSRPLLALRGSAQLLLVPLTFIVVNLMSLAVPSGATLAVLLGATLYPALVGAGMSPLTAGAIIGTSATIMPSPLAADSIEAAHQLKMSIGDYVFGNNAKVSIPAILIMALVHTFWQRYQDRRDMERGREIGKRGLSQESVEAAKHVPGFYALFPVLPLLSVLVLYILKHVGVISFEIGLVEITLACLFVVVVIELIRQRTLFDTIGNTASYFKGMGDAVTGVVSIIIAAGFLIEGIQQMGVLKMLLNKVSGLHGAAMLIGLAFVGVAVLLGLMTGSGLAAFFALMPVVPGIAASTGAAGPMISVPLQCAASLARSGSPVAASTLISAGIAGVEPQQLLKRTLPVVLSGIVSSVVVSWIVL